MDEQYLTPTQLKRAQGKKQFDVYNYDGEYIGTHWNKFPAGAAKKAVSKNYSRVIVFDPVKGKPYGYMGKRIKLKPHQRTWHHENFGINYTPKVYSHPFHEIASPEFLEEIMGY